MASQKGLKNRIWLLRYGQASYVPCCYCKLLLSFRQATLEHLKPRAYGGTDADVNLDIACRKCNNARGAVVTNQLNALGKQIVYLEKEVDALNRLIDALSKDVKASLDMLDRIRRSRTLHPADADAIDRFLAQRIAEPLEPATEDE